VATTKSAGRRRGARWPASRSRTGSILRRFQNNGESLRRRHLPALARENWKLKIHGASVERPNELGCEDLLRMPSKTIIATRECHGSGRTPFWEQDGLSGRQVGGGNWVLGAVGQAEWQSVPMRETFARVGVKRDAGTVLFRSGVDRNDMGRPMPCADVVAPQNDMGVCFAMNGNPLTPDHARPEFSADDEFIGVTAEDIKGPMVTWMPPKSFITVPLVVGKSPSVPANHPLRRGEVPRLPAGRQLLRGHAWAPLHGVRSVEVRVDGGAWQQATIRPPSLGRYTWVRFDIPWNATPGHHGIETRTTDDSGTTQPASVPINSLGMANWAIPKFRVEVV